MGNAPTIQCKTIVIQDGDKFREFDTCNPDQINEYHEYARKYFKRYIDVSNAPKDAYLKLGTRRINELIESKVVE